MSHSQSHRIQVYTQTCMAQSLRQAYDYWQDQPDYYALNFIPSTASFHLTQLTQLQLFQLPSSPRLLHFRLKNFFPLKKWNNPPQEARLPSAREPFVRTQLCHGREGLCSCLRPEALKICADQNTSFSHYFPLIGTYNVTPFSFSLWVPLIYAKKNVLRFLLWGDEISVKSTKKYFNLPKQIFSKTNHYLKKNIR